jgi:hypothetical protein
LLLRSLRLFAAIPTGEFCFITVHAEIDKYWVQDKAPEGWSSPRRYAVDQTTEHRASVWTAVILHRFSHRHLNVPISTEPAKGLNHSEIVGFAYTILYYS